MTESDQSDYEPLTDEELAQIADLAFVEMDKEEAQASSNFTLPGEPYHLQ